MQRAKFYQAKWLKLCGLVVGTFIAGAAWAQSWPTRSVRIVVPFSAGGAVDTLARLIAARLTESLKQPIIIDNRPGAGGNLGTDLVAKAPADGYTVLQTTNGHTISPALFKKLPFDVLRDFAPVTQLVSSAMIMIGSNKLPASSVSELLALARAKPGALNYGTTGVGNPLHLTMELFKLSTNVNMTMVPYKGDAPLIAAMLAGELDFAVVPLATSITNVRAGKVKALAITTAQRTPVFADLPTIAESGVPGFEASSWQGYFVPAGTPREIIVRLREETARVLALPEVRERQAGFGNQVVGSTPEQFDVRVRSDVESFARVIRDAKIPQQE